MNSVLAAAIRQRIMRTQSSGSSGGGQVQPTNGSSAYVDPRFVGSSQFPYEWAITDPFTEARNADPSGYARFMDPSGDPELYRVLRQRSETASFGRRRQAVNSARLRAGGNPSASGYAAMLADVGSQSDLSRGLADASERSVLANRSFREGLTSRRLDAADRRDSEYRGAVQRYWDREHQYALWRKQQKHMKKSQSVGVGPVNYSF